MRATENATFTRIQLRNKVQFYYLPDILPCKSSMTLRFFAI